MFITFYLMCLSPVEPLFSFNLIKLCLYTSVLRVSFAPLLVMVLSRTVTPAASYISSVLELPCVSLCTHVPPTD